MSNVQTWNKFCEENPAFSNERTVESKVGNKIYRQQFQDRVASGEMSYATALVATRDLVSNQLTVEEMTRTRGAGVEGRASFSTAPGDRYGAKPRLW